MLAVVIGASIEFLQSLGDRPPSLFDVCTDAAGAAMGLALLAFVERSRLPRPRPPVGSFGWLLAALAVTGALFVFWQPVQTARAYVAREQGLPRLMEFENAVALPLTLRILDDRHHWELDPPPSLSIVTQAGTRANFRID